jgi:hypothetical protein
MEPEGVIRENGLDGGQDKNTVSNPIFKFLIGTFAVMAAAVIPRLVAALGTPGEVHLVGFTKDYLVVSTIFAAMVGLTLVIFEWRVPRVPRDSFMVALGIPGVLVGAFNTTVLTRQIDSIGQTQTAAFQKGATEIGVSIDNSSPPIQLPEPKTPGVTGSLFDWQIVPRVQAQQPATDDGQRHLAQAGNVGIEYKLPRYYVTLTRPSSQQEAEAAAGRLKNDFPGATAVRQGDAFVVVESIQPKLSSEALAIAARAKQKNLNPTLIPMR